MPKITRLCPHIPYPGLAALVLPWDNPTETGSKLHSHMEADEVRIWRAAQWHWSGTEAMLLFAGFCSNSAFLLSYFWWPQQQSLCHFPRESIRLLYSSDNCEVLPGFGLHATQSRQPAVFVFSATSVQGLFVAVLVAVLFQPCVAEGRGRRSSGCRNT